MTINANIEARLAIIGELLRESDRAHENDCFYDEGRFLAAARDDCDVLIDRVESLGTALRERNYPHERFYAYGERVRNIRTVVARLLQRVETKLAAN